VTQQGLDELIVSIHGQLHGGELVTLLRTRLRAKTAFNWASRFSSDLLAVGAHTARRAGIDPAVIKANKKARQLIGALRKYHAHLRLPGSVTVDEIAYSTYDSTRRLHGSLIAARYQSWSIP